MKRRRELPGHGSCWSPPNFEREKAASGKSARHQPDTNRTFTIHRALTGVLNKGWDRRFICGQYRKGPGELCAHCDLVFVLGSREVGASQIARSALRKTRAAI